MLKKVTFLSRKPSAQYFSIEGIFETIKQEVSKSYLIFNKYLKYSGGSPLTIVKNILVFKHNQLEIYHITGDVHYMALATGKRTVLTIHDIGSALKGSIFKLFYIKLFWFWLPALRVGKITVISEFTKQELIRVVPFAKDKIVVVPNPMNSIFSPKTFAFNSDCPMILIVGTKLNKNLDRIFEAVINVTCKLYIIGALTEKQILKLKSHKILYTNEANLSQDEVVKAYQNCDMLCFPSTYEGFGMPIIEAQATGIPVVTSNLGAMREVAEDTACLVDPFSVKSIQDGIKKIIENSSYREDLVKKGFHNIKRFRLDIIVKKYMDIYQEVARL
ncbi:glycosyltransferase family 4 protein [Winogradskyella flava]|uniref:glycosyltransferase family 4 protein n=1 Tax=Winogradskyella flava TaxID=1884876 RepID=UPI002491EB95|nr:glycosyltransferase family 1 protein [Winogradskyella flava]